MNPIRIDGLFTLGDRFRWALISPDGLYRYALGMTWDEEPCERPIFDVRMKNPSWADHRVDDPTFVRVVGFAKAHGCGGLLIRNCAAFRTDDPRELAKVTDPVGPRNYEVLALDPFFAMRVAAWGAWPSKKVRIRCGGGVAAARSGAHLVFGLTADGSPKHPLFVPASARVMSWEQARERRAAA